MVLISKYINDNTNVLLLVVDVVVMVVLVDIVVSVVVEVVLEVPVGKIDDFFLFNLLIGKKNIVS